MKQTIYGVAVVLVLLCAAMNTEHSHAEAVRDHIGQTLSESLDYPVTMIEWVTFNPHGLSVPEFFEFHGKALTVTDQKHAANR
jgi:hypothetical protein